MGVCYVYFAHDGAPEERVKIGLSSNLSERMRALRCDLLFAVPCDPLFAVELEAALHEQFAASSLTPYFDGHLRHRCGWTEWFTVSDRMRRLIRYVRLTGMWPWTNTRVIR